MSRLSPLLFLLALLPLVAQTAPKKPRPWGPTAGPVGFVPKSGGEPRFLALVVGNADYPIRSGGLSPLTNPIHDATRIKKSLEDSGFQVTPAYNLSLRDMERQIDGFLENVREDDMVIIFYSGHGTSTKDDYFLLPIDFELTNEANLKRWAYSVKDLAEKVRSRNPGAKALIIDACRNNLYSKDPKSVAPDPGALPGYRDFLFAWASNQGGQADDQPSGEVSLFTQELLRAMQQPGLNMGQILLRTVEPVKKSTGGRQVPTISLDTVAAKVILRPPTPAPPPPKAVTPAEVGSAAATESGATSVITSAQVFQKPASATSELELPNSDATLWYDSTIWRVKPSEGVRTELSMRDDFGVAGVISEPVGGFSLSAVESAVMTNARNLDPGATLVERQVRQVNGREVVLLHYKAKANGVELEFFNYAFGGVKSNLQVFTLCPTNLCAKLLPRYFDLMNGLVIRDPAAPPTSPGIANPGGSNSASMLDGKVVLKYDSDSWRRSANDDANSPTFEHKWVPLYAKLIAEPIEFPVTSLLGIATENIRSVDPQAKVESAAPLSIAGIPMQCRRMDAKSQGVTLGFFGCYQTGAWGSLQMIGWTVPTKFDELKPELLKLFEGLQLKP